MLAIKRKIHENATKRKVKHKRSALLTAAIDSNKLLKELGQKINGHEERITVEMLLDMSEEQNPSLLFPTGGLLFDFFFLSQGSVTAHGRLNKMFADDAPECQVEQLQLEILRQHRHKFWYWVMSSCHSVSRKSCTRQMFYVSLLADFRGLSIAGRDMFSMADHVMPAETYRRYKNEAAEKQARILEDMIRLRNIVQWWDNYVHNLKRVRLSIKDGPYVPCTFTGIAYLSPSPISPPHDLLRVFLNGQPVRCIPDLNEVPTLYIDYVIQHLLKVERMEFGDFEINCKRIFNAPLKADEGDASPYSFSDFFCCDVVRDFIGCTEGFHKLLKRHLAEIEAPEFGNRYSMLLFDIKPYGSLIHLAHSPACPSPLLYNKVCPILGFWHPAKMVCEIYWKHFGGWFLAPAWHNLFPTGRYLNKPRLLSMLIFFNSIRASVPDWHQDLVAAMAMPGLCQGARDTLRNLRDLVIYYIPVVQEYLCALKKRDFERMMELWWHLLVIVGIFDNTHYVYPMLFSAIQLRWLKVNCVRIYNFIKDNLAAFDEERGEVSFAMLRCSVLRDTDLSNAEKLGLNYKLLPVVAETQKDIKLDSGRGQRVSKHWNIQEGADEVTVMTEWFKQVIAQCVQGTWQSYADATEVPNFRSLPNREQSKEFVRQEWMPRVEFSENREKYFREKIDRLKKNLNKRNAKEHEMRVKVWNLQPVEWDDDAPEDLSAEAEEAHLAAEDLKIDEEIDEQEGDGVCLTLAKPFQDGDEYVYLSPY